MIEILKARSGNCCELCGATENLGVYTVPPARNESTDNSLLVCDTCLSQIENPSTMDSNHWRCSLARPSIRSGARDLVRFMSRGIAGAANSFAPCCWARRLVFTMDSSDRVWAAS